MMHMKHVAPTPVDFDGTPIDTVDYRDGETVEFVVSDGQTSAWVEMTRQELLDLLKGFDENAPEEHPHDEETMEYRATIGAPGRGQVWECRLCDKELIKIGTTWIDPDEVPNDEEPPWVLDSEDVR